MNDRSEKKRILFVDDEPNVLNGLRRLLHSMHGEWEMAFANGGEEALRAMAERPFDVIISDLRMPGMDGVQLLNEVKKRYPDTVRFVLSGHADKSMILRSVGPAHQFLAKPCNPDLLITSITRAFSLRDLLHGPAMQEAVRNVRSLPALPDIYRELVDALQSPNATMNEIATIVSRDVAMAAKILQLVNSAFFGLRRQVESIAQAVSFIGTETIASLTLTSGVFDQFTAEDVAEFGIKEIYDHSLAVGAAAGRLIRRKTKDKKLADEATLAGMTHDFGKLILIKNMPDTWREVRARARNDNRLLYAVEREKTGISHAEIGAYLLGLWGVCDHIVEAVAYHHRPSDGGHGEFDTLFAVHLAAAFCHKWYDSATDWTIYLDLPYVHSIVADEEMDELEAIARPPAVETD